MKKRTAFQVRSLLLQLKTPDECRQAFERLQKEEAPFSILMAVSHRFAELSK